MGKLKPIKSPRHRRGKERNEKLILNQLLSHTPDLVALRSPESPVPETFQLYGIVLFADISGFTALCEKYCNDDKTSDGIDQLTTTLNSYLSKIVAAILNIDGDIVKFAGDAFLAFWSCSKFEVVQVLRLVLRECVILQTNYDNYLTADGVTLRMKLGLSVGNVGVFHIGNGDYRMLDLAGEAVDDANKAQNLAPSGSVVLSPPAWDMCDKPFCCANFMGNEGYVKVSKVSLDPYDDNILLNNLVLRGVRRPTKLGIANPPKKLQKTLPEVQARSLSSRPLYSEPNPFSPKKNPRLTSSSSSSDSVKSDKMGNQVRETLQRFIKNIEKSKDFISSYVQKTAMNKINHGHDASWLSELRKVSVLFINLDPGEKLDDKGKLTMLQGAFDAIYPSLEKYGGSLNKVFMFDKGCTFLCIFGLPHAKHEDDSERALRAASDISSLLKMLTLKHFSIGVTRGAAVCGVVGHPKRHEYTVIGQKVNMAARLMMKFPDLITCDESTKKTSRLPDHFFSPMPPTPLKGIQKPEDIFSFTYEKREHHDSICPEIHYSQEKNTLVGRKEEISVILEELDRMSKRQGHSTSIIAISGPGGIGKTKLLKAFKATAADNGFRVISTVAGVHEQNNPFYIAKVLISRLLAINKCKNLHEREQQILSSITTPEQEEMLPLLNDLLGLKFPQTSKILSMSHQEKPAHLHRLLLSMVHQIVQNTPCLFGIDDAHLVDEDSWPFLLDLSSDPNTILTIAMRTRKLKNPNSPAFAVLHHPNTKRLELKSLSDSDTTDLACQILDCEMIPPELGKILSDKTHGIPLWCEELVENMVQNGLLQVSQSESVELRLNDTKITEDTEPALNDFKEESLTKDLVTDNNAIKPNKKRGGIVRFARSIRPEDISVPDTVTGMILARFDNLSPDSQLQLKCASVLGNVFSRAMLDAIVPDNLNEVAFKKGLDDLASFGLIACSHATHSGQTDQEEEGEGSNEPSCMCVTHTKKQSLSHGAGLHPKICTDWCTMFEFVHPYVRETVYGLWTNSQRRDLHEKAALFLESQAHKCESCGGGGFAMLGDQKSTKEKKQATSTKGRAFVGTVTRPRTRRASIAGRRRNSVAPMMMYESSSHESSMFSLQQAVMESNKRQSLVGSLLEDSSALIDCNLQDCHCDDILVKVYPQLIRHWKEVGCDERVLHYLIEAGAAAVSTFNNLEAYSLLQEAHEIAKRKEMAGVLSQHEEAELESLIGQALFQSGEVGESMTHFSTAMKLLGSKVPHSKLSCGLHLIKMGVKQLLHKRFPRRFMASQHGLRSELCLDQARCLSHITHAYHLQHKNWQTLMAALHQLNMAEEAEENNHDLIEAYTTMIECCQLFGLQTLAKSYLEKALKCCEKVESDVSDLLGYAHFLSVALNFSLHQGDVLQAVNYGKAAIKITEKLHEVPIKLVSMTLLSQAYIASDDFDKSFAILNQISSVAEESDDLRSKAFYQFFAFDAVLDTGLVVDDFEEILQSARKCKEDDVYHFDREERFAMLTCLALWNARKGEWNEVKQLLATIATVVPSHFESYLPAKALCRLVECELLYYQSHPKERTCLNKLDKDLKVLKRVTKHFAVFQPRLHILNAYKAKIEARQRQISQNLNKAISLAQQQGHCYDLTWARHCVSHWSVSGIAPANLHLRISQRAVSKGSSASNTTGPYPSLPFH